MGKISKDDPRFTAKALGERSQELDALEIAAEDAPEFKETEDFAKQLEAELGSKQEAEQLSESQIEELQKSHSRSRQGNALLSIPAWVYSLAACVTIGLFSVMVMNRKTAELSQLPPLPMEVDAVEQEKPVGNGRIESSKGQTAKFENAPILTPFAPSEKKSNIGVLTKEFTSDLEAAETFELSPFRGRADTPRKAIEAVSQDFAISSGSASTEGASGNFATTLQADPAPRLETSMNVGIGAPARIIRPQFPPYQPAPPTNREAYTHIEENAFRSALDNPLSTFSIDVDTASYSNMRRMIEAGVRPVADAIRIEELINYFKYDYPEPKGEAPFSVNIESASAPWKPEHQLLRIGLKGKTVSADERPDANLVFLVDVSGSMGSPGKLPLAQTALKLLVEQMGTDDRIAIVVYAGSSGLVLPSTTANNQETIRHAIDNLRSGGSTNGGAGIELAYKVAVEKFIEGGINRVILCTDGDFNVGVTDDGSLIRLIEAKAKSGVFFSAIGFGRGNYQDGKMEQLSNKGNGNYAYIDSKQEARKVFVDDMLGTLHTIAKDVKIQVDFNPSKVSAYRIIGYVNRKLAKEDFNDDKKDAGEIGAGHSVTAFYEIVPAGVDFDLRDVDASKYQRPPVESSSSEEWLTVKLRFKEPDSSVSELIDFPYTGDIERGFSEASADFRFASSVAGFGMLLRDSAHKGDLTMDGLIEISRAARSNDASGLRSEFIELAHKAKLLLNE